MRAVSISDTCDARAELIVPQMYTFVEQRRDGSPRLDAQAPLIAEAHAPGNTFVLRLRIDGALLRAAHRGRRRDEWIDVEQRVRRAFGREVAGLLPDASDAQLERAVVARIETAARRFAKAVVAAEQCWEEKHGHGSTNALRDFYEKLASLLEKGPVPLRLGWGSHFTDTTLLLVLREDEGWRPILKRCFRVFDIGVPPGQRGGVDRTIDLYDFPRSRRLVADAKKRPVAPLGWVVLAPTAEELPGSPVDKGRLIVRAQGDQPGPARREPASKERAGPTSTDPASEEANRIKGRIQNLRGKGDVSKMPEIVKQLAQLSDPVARYECAQQLQHWLMSEGKKSLWKDKKHATADWRQQLNSLLEQKQD